MSSKHARTIPTPQHGSQPNLKLTAKISPSKSAQNNAPRTFHCVTCFPWRLGSLETMWKGSKAALYEDDDESQSLRPEFQQQWLETIKRWAYVIAAGGGSKVQLIASTPSQPAVPLFSIAIPDELRVLQKDASITAITWCMMADSDGFTPLLAFAAGSLIYVFDVRRGSFHGILRGHGADITSLTANPIDPSILCSTSHDFTVRIYNLRLPVFSADDKVTHEKDPFCKWPMKSKSKSKSKDKQPLLCLAGPAFGLRANDGEGTGKGRCMIVLAGGITGGHQAGVLNAAFHPTLPIIATCGMDNAVKLWHLPPMGNGDRLRREDKPIFSSGRLHSSHVRSVSWLGPDLLLTHSSPGVIRAQEADESLKLEDIPGSLVLWRWLSLKRFYPEGFKWPETMRGCVSDYTDSYSFKVISSVEIPVMKSVRLHVTHTVKGPIALFTTLQDVTALNLTDMPPLERSPFPPAEKYEPVPIYAMVTKCDAFWTIASCGDHGMQLEACAIGENGNLLIGVGKDESIYIWRTPNK